MAKEHLLFIDADKDGAAVMELGLRQSGYSVARAQDAQSALDLIRESAPSLIVCDLDSCSDSELLLKSLLGSQAGSDICPCIFLCDERTRLSTEGSLRPARRVCLEKPVYLRELIARVELVLERRRRAQWSSREGGRARFSGELRNLGVVDLMQTIAISKKSGVVSLNTEDGKGAIWFKEGALIDASFGKLQAEAAVYRMIRLDSGSFGVHFKSVRRAKAMSSTTNEILLEGLSQRDQWLQYCEQLPCLDKPLVADPAPLKGQVNADVSELLRRFKGKRTIRSVLQETRRNDLELLQLISEVYFKGALVEAGSKSAPELEDKKDEARELTRSDAPSRRPLSATQPLIHDGPVARPRARPKAVTQRLSPPGPGPLSPTPAVDNTGNSGTGRPRVARTLVIPYSSRDDAQAPSHTLPQDAPVLAGTSSRRPQSSTMIYHEGEDTEVSGPFARALGSAVAVARDPEPPTVAANDTHVEPNAPELKVVEEESSKDEQSQDSGEFEGRSALEGSAAKERRQEMMAELECSSRGLRRSELPGQEKQTQEEPSIEASANDSGSRMYVSLEEGNSDDEGRLLSVVILVACALVVAYVLGAPDSRRDPASDSFGGATEPTQPKQPLSSAVPEAKPELESRSQDRLIGGPSCQAPEIPESRSTCEGPQE